MNYRYTKQRGFTLMELMIVVVIVGILAAIAIPSYQDSMQKSRLQTAKGVMVELVQLVERSYSLNNRYPDASTIPSALTTSPRTGDGSTTYFNIVYTPTNSNTTYTIVATVRSPYAPSTCRSLQLNSTGERLASDTTTITAGTTAISARCWGG